jgi:serine/threonine protein kinase
VLCDFGTSDNITERIGQKTLTDFCGTLGYMSREMKGLMDSQQPGLVDLFYNDAYGMSLAIYFAM